MPWEINLESRGCRWHQTQRIELNRQHVRMSLSAEGEQLVRNDPASFPIVRHLPANLGRRDIEAHSRLPHGRLTSTP